MTVECPNTFSAFLFTGQQSALQSAVETEVFRRTICLWTPQRITAGLMEGKRKRETVLLRS